MEPSLRRVAPNRFDSNTDALTTAEDFADDQRKIPGVYFFLGVAPKGADPKSSRRTTPRDSTRTKARWWGVRALASVAVDYLFGAGSESCGQQPLGRAEIHPGDRPAAGRNFAGGLTTSGLGPPDLDRAVSQHRAYVETSRFCGLEVVQLPADEKHPDSTFVEDTAVCVASGAIITRPGAESRREEIISIMAALRLFFPQPASIRKPRDARRRRRLRRRGYGLHRLVRADE